MLDDMADGRPVARHASLRGLRDPATGEVLDQALILWMPAPHSFTGEDTAELHLHGGAAVRKAVLAALAARCGFRPAEAGEFTRRAFLNGRMDLTAVEGLADMIDAETEAQRRQALRQLEGRLSSRAGTWRERLIALLAACEAVLDFADEDDVPDEGWMSAAGGAAALADELRDVLRQGSRGERLREGFTVVLAGPVNAGKSSLLNAIAQRDVAIVSPLPGTTRDAIELRCDLGGMPVTFVDTAGLRDSVDPIEQIGIRRADDRMRSADLVLWLAPADQSLAVPPPAGVTAPLVTLVTKTDLVPASEVATDLAVSAATGRHIGLLLEWVQDRAAAEMGSGEAMITRERHRRALLDAAEALERVQAAAAAGAVELVAEDLRLALRALARLVGTVDVEDVLDLVFAQFCIGK